MEDVEVKVVASGIVEKGVKVIFGIIVIEAKAEAVKELEKISMISGARSTDIQSNAAKLAKKK